MCNFSLALVLINLLKLTPEMKKIFTFILFSLICVLNADAVTRVITAQNRTKSNTNSSEYPATLRSTATNKPSTNSTRSAQITYVLGQSQSGTTQSRTLATRTPARTGQKNTSTSTRQNLVSRAADTTQSNIPETRTGIEYERCKNAFFACMDQFCELKNDNYRRCSCSDRVYDFQEVTKNYQQVSDKLSEFAENLDVVGMTYDQAYSMKTASEGESALAEDKSASKQLLQAIMNAIKGENSSVSGKYENLNSIVISSDVTNAFGLDNSGQIVASYNGTNLYKAVFPTCKSVVEETCNKASLQRAINAYLMAIEQDCNTVESALQAQYRSLKTATHENSALLDLARVENRQKHNSDDIATCIENVERAIKSEQVCGDNYHKCLDYGQFIDVTTGKPLTGVVDFYKLGEMLTFKTAENLDTQKLSSISENRKFVQFFEDRTKKFAQIALDKCTENADIVWQQFMDMALIDIYYAQQTKVDSVEQNCFDLITACYNDQGAAITSAMAKLTGDNSMLLKPAAINLTNQLCSDYIDSCSNMFGGNIISKYVNNKKSTDSETACRAVAYQCFNKFGGNGYENFYSPQSGLFKTGEAIDWFSLYDDTDRENIYILSPCAKELASTEGCGDAELLEKVFGGFNKSKVSFNSNKIIYARPGSTNDREIRPHGVASEVYAKIVNNLSTQCENIDGYFVEHQLIEAYDYNTNNFCQLNTSDRNSIFYRNNAQKYLHHWYRFIENENVCPANYATRVDTQSWGACSCWENGGYRSANGTTDICRPLLPFTSTTSHSSIPICNDEILENPLSTDTNEYQWCQQPVMSLLSQVCPRMDITDKTLCGYKDGNAIKTIEPVLEYVRQYKITETSKEALTK